MNIEHIFTHTLRALDGSPQRTAATEPRPRVGIAQEGSSSPCADLGTAEVSVLHTTHMSKRNDPVEYTLDYPVEAAAELESLRRKKTEHERFVAHVRELLNSKRFDDALSFVEDEFTAINGPTR